MRNRAKWGLRIVDLDWLVQSTRVGKRLDEAAFPAALPPLPLPASSAKEQAAANAILKPPAGSRGNASSLSSLQAADTYDCQPGRQHGLFSAATVAAAGAWAQRAAAQPLQQSVNSRPLSSFRQPSCSLHTQSPSLKRSTHPQTSASAQHTAGRTGSTGRGGVPGASAAEFAVAAVAGGLLPEVETRSEQQDGETGAKAMPDECTPLRCCCCCVCALSGNSLLHVRPVLHIRCFKVSLPNHNTTVLPATLITVLVL